MKTQIQFIKGIEEKVLPNVRLTRSRDGSTGTATFRFNKPNVIDKSLSLKQPLADIISQYKINDKIELTIIRDSKEQKISVTLEERNQ